MRNITKAVSSGLLALGLVVSLVPGVTADDVNDSQTTKIVETEDPEINAQDAEILAFNRKLIGYGSTAKGLVENTEELYISLSATDAEGNAEKISKMEANLQDLQNLLQNYTTTQNEIITIWDSIEAKQENLEQEIIELNPADKIKELLEINNSNSTYDRMKELFYYTIKCDLILYSLTLKSVDWETFDARLETTPNVFCLGVEFEPDDDLPTNSTFYEIEALNSQGNIIPPTNKNLMGVTTLKVHTKNAEADTDYDSTETLDELIAALEKRDNVKVQKEKCAAYEAEIKYIDSMNERLNNSKEERKKDIKYVEGMIETAKANTPSVDPSEDPTEPEDPDEPSTEPDMNDPYLKEVSDQIDAFEKSDEEFNNKAAALINEITKLHDEVVSKYSSDNDAKITKMEEDLKALNELIDEYSKEPADLNLLLEAVDEKAATLAKELLDAYPIEKIKELEEAVQRSGQKTDIVALIKECLKAYLTLQGNTVTDIKTYEFTDVDKYDRRHMGVTYKDAEGANKYVIYNIRVIDNFDKVIEKAPYFDYGSLAFYEMTTKYSAPKGDAVITTPQLLAFIKQKQNTSAEKAKVDALDTFHKDIEDLEKKISGSATTQSAKVSGLEKLIEDAKANKVTEPSEPIVDPGDDDPSSTTPIIIPISPVIPSTPATEEVVDETTPEGAATTGSEETPAETEIVGEEEPALSDTGTASPFLFFTLGMLCLVGGLFFRKQSAK